MPVSLEDLDRLYKPPSPVALNKVLDRIDRHGRAFIGLSPFCVVGTTGPDGRQSVSPRGGQPGFARVSDDGRLLQMPDRPGNNRLDTLHNLLAGSGRIALMFMIPGFGDVYRLGGRAAACDEPALLSSFEAFGKRPRLVIEIAVEESFFHCPKAIMRARLWEADAQVARDRLPSGPEMIFDQLQLGAPPVTTTELMAFHRTQF